ncbi:hypothetical protein FSARC_11391 [Fusarium sarcochroum]|uniref:Uncharacterized protein n=1 Tax=Fusarium sarcochroum TaxID=1208366 RepID=A0A8H4TFR7_9HYPO|nr:hypothetical protein FSARC_11391 [Fusarium sarcochroum]
MRRALFVLYCITAITKTSASPLTSPIDTPGAISTAPPTVETATSPGDIEDAIGQVGSLANDILMQANNIGGDGVQIQILGNTYLRCRDMIEGVQQAFNKISVRPETLFGYEDQKSICYMFDSFGINQSKLLTVLAKDPENIAKDGFIERFGGCFTRLRPALINFIEALAAYAPECEADMLRRRDQLEAEMIDLGFGVLGVAGLSLIDAGVTSGFTNCASLPTWDWTYDGGSSRVDTDNAWIAGRSRDACPTRGHTDFDENIPKEWNFVMT